MSDATESVKNPTTKPSKRKAPKSKAPRPEEAPGVKVVRANRRRTRKSTAHVPGPRRKPTLDPVASQWAAEEESGAAASAEAKDSDEGDAFK